MQKADVCQQFLKKGNFWQDNSDNEAIFSSEVGMVTHRIHKCMAELRQSTILLTLETCQTGFPQIYSAIGVKN